MALQQSIEAMWEGGELDPGPIEEAISRCGSFVDVSATTVNRTWPAWSFFRPSFRDTILQRGGKMLDTRTMLNSAIFASRSASSNDASFSR